MLHVNSILIKANEYYIEAKLKEFRASLENGNVKMSQDWITTMENEIKQTTVIRSQQVKAMLYALVEACNNEYESDY